MSKNSATRIELEMHQSFYLIAIFFFNNVCLMKCVYRASFRVCVMCFHNLNSVKHDYISSIIIINFECHIEVYNSSYSNIEIATF